MEDNYSRGVFSLDINENSPFHRQNLENLLFLLEDVSVRNLKVSKVLDAGCGPGFFIERVDKVLPGIFKAGLDISFLAVNYARQQHQGISYVQGDIVHLPFQPACFDLVLLNNVIEHVPNPIQLISEIHQILVPDGYLVLSTPSRYRYDNLVRIIVGKTPQLMAEDHYVEYSTGQVAEILRRNGFEVLRTYGKDRKPDAWSYRNAISYFIIKPFLGILIKVIKSNHILASTLFVLAKRAG